MEVFLLPSELLYRFAFLLGIIWKKESLLPSSTVSLYLHTADHAATVRTTALKRTNVLVLIWLSL